MNARHQDLMTAGGVLLSGCADSPFALKTAAVYPARVRASYRSFSQCSNALTCVFAIVLVTSACGDDDAPGKGSGAGTGGGSGSGHSSAHAGSGTLSGSGGGASEDAGEGGRAEESIGNNGISGAGGSGEGGSSAPGGAGYSGSAGSESAGQGGGGTTEIGGAGGASDGGEGGSAGDLGGPVTGNPCTGPGPNNAGNVSGFPPGPTKTLDTGPWSGWGVSHGNLDAAVDVDGVGSALHTAAPGDSRTSYFLAPASLLGDLSEIAGVRFALKTEYSGGGYYESGYQYKGDVVLQGASGSATAYAMITHAPDSQWHYYYVPFQASDTCWSTAEESLAEVLSSVTGLGIRAEFSTGTDNTWLADFALIPR